MVTSADGNTVSPQSARLLADIKCKPPIAGLVSSNLFCRPPHCKANSSNIPSLYAPSAGDTAYQGFKFINCHLAIAYSFALPSPIRSGYLPSFKPL